MAISAAERIEQRTPFRHHGFRHSNIPEATITDYRPGFIIHFYEGKEFRKNKAELFEYAVDLHMAGFDIPREVAENEVDYNFNNGRAISVAFVALVDSPLLVPMEQSHLTQGRERVSSSIITRLVTPLTKLVNSQGESLKEKPQIKKIRPFAGYASQENWRIKTSVTTTREVVFYTAAVLLPGCTGKGIGQALLKIPFKFFKPVGAAGRFQTGAGISTVEKALGIYDQQATFGVEREWNEDQEMMNFGKYFEERTLHLKGFDAQKFIAIAVYPEGESRVYKHGLTNGRAKKAHELMIQRGVDFPRGDGCYAAVMLVELKGRQRFYSVLEIKQELPLSAG